MAKTPGPKATTSQAAQYASETVKTLLGIAPGYTYEHFLETCDQYRVSLRIYKDDGKARVCTRDYKTNRINVNLENGIIKDAHVG